MPVKLSPLLNDQQFSANGVPLSGGKIETYLAGSSTLATTFTTIAENVAQTNPIILNTRGEVDNLIWLNAGVSYKFILKDSANNVLRTYDNVNGVNDTVVNTDQWVASGAVPTFVSATQFTLAGDQTTAFHVNRRVKLLVTGGTVYGFISASVFGALTTVTVILDASALDAGLSSVQLGLITPVNTSLRVTSALIADTSVSPVKLSTGGPTWTSAGELTVVLPALLGYGAGAGGAVTQLTSKATAVTLNKPVGVITTSNAALAAGAEVQFVVNNTLVGVNDIIVVNGSIAPNYTYRNSIASAGLFNIFIKNQTAGSLSDVLTINFIVFKGASA